MELKLVMRVLLCEEKEFEINGVPAYSKDFGKLCDRDKDNAVDYGCSDMRFYRKASTVEVLDKYKITEREYQEIAEKLEDGLSFGSCGLCD